jgi:hypothetical protein
MPPDHQVACIGYASDHREIQFPLVEHGLGPGFRSRLQHHQHAFLAFRQHQLVGAHAGFALRHLVQVDVDADMALGRHLDRRGGQPRCTHVLDGDDGIHAHQFQAGFQQ